MLHVACGTLRACAFGLGVAQAHVPEFIQKATHTKCKWPATIGADIVAASAVAVAVAAAPISCTI